MGPPASHGVTRVPWYSGYCHVIHVFAYETITLYGMAFQPSSANIHESIMQSATPVILLYPVWPLSLSLAATKEIDVSFSSSADLDVSVQRVSLHHTILFTAQYLGIAQVGCPIRKSTDRYLFTVPRSLSQLVTSFFGS